MAKFKLIKTKMMNRYSINFLVRLAIFITVFVLYIIRRDVLTAAVTHKFSVGTDLFGFTFLHLVWAFFMIMMIRHLFPIKNLSMALRKNEKENFQEVEGYSETELLKFVQNQNVKAWKVMLVWLSFNAIWGILYLCGVIEVADLLMLTVFYFLCDYICILFFCPFQKVIMKNKCCVNCRIYDWGHFMMFTPMLFIQNFFSWSLFFTSVVVLIRWEISYAQNPQRFWSGSNKTLQCANCKDKTCQIKKRLTGTK